LNYFNYFTEIEETFVRRRGKHLFLSPIDWAMIEGWQDRGIPLHIVIRGIETVFDGFEKKPGPRSIKGLLYCREEIEAQYHEWLSMQTGKSDQPAENAEPGGSIDGVAAGIRHAIESLDGLTNENLREDLERACERLRGLEANLGTDLEAIDKSLSDIEKFLDQALLTKAGEAHLSKIEKDISEQLKPYKKGMDAETYKSTFNLMLLKRLREDEGVPRLGLFYL
jgi:hypothetical protein